MNNNSTKTLPRPTSYSRSEIIHALILAALAIGFILAVVSWARVCSQACSEGHNYRLYGFTFEAIGIPFFGALALAQFFSKRIPALTTAVGAAISGAVGAELMFTYAQKYIIGHWCPICLSIAASIFIAFLLIAYQYLDRLLNIINNGQKGEIMRSISKGFICVLLITFGFVFSQAGFAKFNKLQAAENGIKESIAFGNLKSPVEVYVFTDWECPSCRKVEPVLEKASPEIMKKARLIYVDLPVHPESMNYTPYNLSFMIKNKPQYFRIRDFLTELSTKTDAPTDEQVEAGAKKLGIKYEQLNYSDVAVGIKYFKHLAKQFSVDRTPTVVIVNKNDKKGKKLIGGSEITEENLLKAIDSLSK